MESRCFLTFTPRNASEHRSDAARKSHRRSRWYGVWVFEPFGRPRVRGAGASAVQSHPYEGEPWCLSKHPFAHRGHKEKVMKNDKVTNEQQAQSKSNRKKWAAYAWEAIKWGIRLFDLITRLVNYFEGGDE